MANKKSFVLYYDTITQFELLNYEELPKLNGNAVLLKIKHIEEVKIVN